MEKQSSETAAEPLAVDVRGAIKMLHLGRSTVLALADRGELPRLRTGRAVRYAISDIERLVERMRSGEQLLTRAKSKPVPHPLIEPPGD